MESPAISRECPACGQPLYGWLQLETAAGPSLLERCESCRLGVAAGLGGGDVSNELLAAAHRLPDGGLELRCANRDSVQARLGGQHWAALDPGRGLYATPGALRMLAEKAGLALERIDTPQGGQVQLWMWQTILNGFTFNQNFATRARAGLLRPSGFAARLKYSIDALVTVLATPLVIVVSVPLELIAAMTGRGGVLVARATQPPEQHAEPDR